MRRLVVILIVTFVGTIGWLSSAEADETGLLKVTPLPFNTSADEDDPHLADGGLTLYFSSVSKGTESLRVARRRGTAAWPAKTIDIDDYVANKGETRSAFATQGRYPHYLFFAARDKEGKNYDLFVAIKHDSNKDWAAPTPVTNVNSEEDECFPWLTGDGKSLYFSRKTKEGWRLLVTTRTNTMGPQGWGEAEVVDLPTGYHHATLTPDGKTMILQGPLEKERWGLFQSTKTGKTWSKPEELVALNHPDGKIGNRSPNISRDGSFLYFASDRPGGKGGLDLYGARMLDLKKKR